MPMPDARTLPALLDEMARRFPDREFVVDGERRWTYAAFRDEARALAKGLLWLGVRPGDNLALLMGNRAEWLFAEFAALMAGATLVAVNTWFRTHELGHVLRHSDAATLIAADRYLGQDYLGMLRAIGIGDGRLPRLRTLVCLPDEGAAAPSGMTPFDRLVALGRQVSDAALDMACARLRPDDFAYILYTSGTTAMPKGALLRHGDIVENGFNIGERMHLREIDRLWVGISLFWAFGCMNALPAIMTHGGAIVLQRHFAPAEALGLIEREHCSVYYGTPNMTLALVEHPDFATRDLSSLRTGLTIGGERAVQLAVALGVRKICQCYGLTEAYGNSAVSDADEPEALRGAACGRPLPGTEIVVADPETHKPLPVGEIGEIKIRGHVMPGYYRDPERNAEAFDAEGFLLSGDLGWLDGAGYVHFHARLKEMLKSGGILFAPREIEDFLAGLPEIGEAHAVGVPDPRKDEVVACAVLLREGARLDAEDLRARCRGALAAYKVPAYIWFAKPDELPRTATGKVQKARLRELFLARIGAADAPNRCC
jgi:fatty-acyl-CoA synthase